MGDTFKGAEDAREVLANRSYPHASDAPLEPPFNVLDPVEIAELFLDDPLAAVVEYLKAMQNELRTACEEFYADRHLTPQEVKELQQKLHTINAYTTVVKDLTDDPDTL